VPFFVEAGKNSGKEPRIGSSGMMPLADVNDTEKPGGRDDSRIIPFQDRGHGMTTDRHAMTFFCARAERDVAGWSPDRPTTED
jgi:hypothetical protein